MKIKKTVWLVFLALTISSMLFVAYAERRNGRDTRKLGVEINVKANPFYFPAATDREVITGLIKVGKAAGASSDSVSGLKIAPKMEGDHVRVDVFAVYGDISGVKSCKDLGAVNSKRIASEIMEIGNSINLSRMASLGPSENGEPFILKIVGLKKEVNASVEPVSGAFQIAGCGSCGTLQCCPSPGKCMGCGDCGITCKVKIGVDEPAPGDGPVGE